MTTISLHTTAQSYHILGAFKTLFSNLNNRYIQAKMRRELREELYALDARHLDDIGIAYYEIESVVRNFTR